MRRLAGVTFGTLALLILLALFMFAPVAQVTAAPPALPTPASWPRDGANWRYVTLFNAQALTADTRQCVESAGWNIANVVWSLDFSNTNTTTVQMQYSLDNSLFANGAALASSTYTDVTDVGQYPLLGIYNCIYVDVATTDTMTVTAQLLLK